VVGEAAVEEWVRAHVQPVEPIEAVHERLWGTAPRSWVRLV